MTAEVEPPVEARRSTPRRSRLRRSRLRPSTHRTDRRRCSTTGTGQYREDGTVRFDVTSPRGEFRYELTEDGDWELEGMFDGRPIPSGG